MKKICGISALAGILFFNNVTAATPAPAERETISQVALLQSLALGYFDGVISVAELKSLGDTGIGTFRGLDGEMIFLDGVMYRANSKLQINVVDDAVKIPFSNVTFFDRDFSLYLKNIADKNSLETKLNESVTRHGANLFYIVKLPASFPKITIRSESGQQKPYPTLVQSLEATQKELTLENVQGTIVGLYCPPYMGGLNTVGWHFHFITDDKKLAGTFWKSALAREGRTSIKQKISA